MIKSILSLTLLSLTCLTGFAQEAEEEKKPWTNKSEVQIVYSDGNSSTTTIGLSNKYQYKWDEDATFDFNVSGVRSENDTTVRTAVINDNAVDIIETEESETTEERYRVQLHYKDKIANKLYWYTGADWHRNVISGIDGRYVASLGLGNTWVKSDTAKFETHYGAEFVHEELTTGAEEDFAALALGYDYMRQITKTSRFDQNFKVSANLDDTDDYRGELESVLTVSISSKMALTTKLHLFYDNQPVVEDIVITNAGSGDPATVAYEFEDLETLFTTSLVINW